jgi:hypothetical protein
MTMRHPRISTTTLSVTLLITLAGCGGSDSSSEAVTPDYEPDTSYLDDLAADKGIETLEPEEPVEIDQTEIATQQEPEETYKDEDREWTEEEGSKSLLGRSRDRARDMRDAIQGGTDPENGIANTTYDEEYAQAAGFAWNMPEDWRMAVPSANHFAEMFIQNPLGNASVVFEKTTKDSMQTKRDLQRYITDTFGSSDAKTSNKTIMGFPVTIFELEGTYIDPSGKGGRNENPFYAIHAALIELPTTKVLIRMWGPQDTVNRNKAKFNTMIEKMYEK